MRRQQKPPLINKVPSVARVKTAPLLQYVTRCQVRVNRPGPEYATVTSATRPSSIHSDLAGLGSYTIAAEAVDWVIPP